MHALFPDGYAHCKATPCQLNSIYTEVSVFHPDLYPDAAANGSRPGWEATKDAVEAITGLQIQYLVTVDMAGFAQLVDALGGITVNVEQRLPIGGQLDDLSDVKSWIEPGVQHMDGNTALWYARARHGSSDYDRMNRQKIVEEAVLRQFDPATVVEKFQSIASAGSQVLSTTVPESMVGTFVDLAIKAKDTDIQKLELDPDSKVDPEHPDWSYIRDLVAKAIAKASPAPAD
jgi:LCP family protein required for cell wall assembly